MYLRYEEFDRRTGETRYRREYVPAVELARVRRWIVAPEPPTPV